MIMHNYVNVQTINQSKSLPSFQVVMTSPAGVNSQSTQTLLRGGNNSKQLDEIKAWGRGCWSGESVSRQGCLMFYLGFYIITGCNIQQKNLADKDFISTVLFFVVIGSWTCHLSLLMTSKYIIQHQVLAHSQTSCQGLSKVVTNQFTLDLVPWRSWDSFQVLIVLNFCAY